MRNAEAAAAESKRKYEVAHNLQLQAEWRARSWQSKFLESERRVKRLYYQISLTRCAESEDEEDQETEEVDGTDDGEANGDAISSGGSDAASEEADR